MLRNQDLNLLPIFDALIQERQLSRAAEKLCMSQPAVSNALKRLRLTFKDDLFVRTRSGLVPTERALELHELVSPALALIGQSLDSGVFDPIESERLINISINTTAETLFFARFAEQIRPLAPKIRFQLVPDYLPEIPARLKDGRLNYAIEFAPLPPESYDSLPLYQETLVAVCAPDHPTLTSNAITLEEYKTLKHVSITPRSSFTPAENARALTPVEQVVGKELPDRKIAMSVTNILSIPEIVAATDLIGTVGRAVAAPFVEKGILRELQLPFGSTNYDIALYWHKSRATDPLHKWLVSQFLSFGALD